MGAEFVKDTPFINGADNRIILVHLELSVVCLLLFPF